MITQEQIDVTSDSLCVPLTIVLNYSLFQYLLIVFYTRRRDPHVRLLLTAAFFSFATLIPFSYPDDDLTRNLNDISEVCTVLTFTQQIAMLTREVNRKMKLPTIAKLGRLAELLVLVGMVLLVANVVQVAAPTAEDMDAIELLDTIVEYTTLVFVVFFRFYFLATVRGWRTVWERQKLEVVYYLLFLTHAVPFHVAADITGLELHSIQGLWMRVTIALCLSSTIKSKIVSMTSGNASKSTGQGSDRHLKRNPQLQRSSVVPSGSRMDWSLSEHTGLESVPGPAVEAAWESSKSRRSSVGKQSSVMPAGLTSKKSLVSSLNASRGPSSRGASGIRGIARAASIRLSKAVRPEAGER